MYNPRFYHLLNEKSGKNSSKHIRYEPRFKAKSAKTQKNPKAINCLCEATQAKTDKDILRKLFGETLFFQIVQLK